MSWKPFNFRYKYNTHITEEIFGYLEPAVKKLYNEHNQLIDDFFNRHFSEYDQTKKEFHYETPAQVARDEFIASLVMLEAPHYFRSNRKKYVIGDLRQITCKVTNIEKLTHNERMWLKKIKRYYSNSSWGKKVEDQRVNSNEDMVIALRGLKKGNDHPMDVLKQEYETMLNEMEEYISIRSMFLFLSMDIYTTVTTIEKQAVKIVNDRKLEEEKRKRQLEIEHQRHIQKQREHIAREKQVTYFLVDLSLNRVKIGTSKNLRSRLSSIKTHNGGTLILAGIIRLDEETCQCEFRRSRIHGEWYEYDDRIIEFIEKHMTKPDKKWCDEINKRMFSEGIEKHKLLLDEQKMSLVNFIVENILA